MRPWALVAVFCAQPVLAQDFDDYACQVVVPVGQPLQTILDVECNVTAGVFCSCNNPMYPGMDQRTRWQFLTPKLNKILAKNCPPGFWYLMDTKRQCGAIVKEEDTPTVLSCPPGFWCAGGLAPPLSCATGNHCPGGANATRMCPRGFYCPFPASPAFPCMPGGECPQGSTRSKPCEAGNFCVHGISQICPEEKFCPSVCEEPQDCNGTLTFCPKGSTHENYAIQCLLIVGSTLGMVSVGASCYEALVLRGGLLIVYFFGIFYVYHFLSKTVGAYLFIIFSVAATNFVGLSKLGKCPPWVAISLLLGTVIAVGATLWYWFHMPACCLLLAQLVFGSYTGWLVTNRIRWKSYAGYALFVAYFFGLVASFAATDPTFLQGYLTLVLAIAVVIVLDWMKQECAARRRPTVAVAPAGDSGGTGSVAPTPPVMSLSSLSEPLVETAAAARPLALEGQEPRRTGGVSFQLEDLSCTVSEGTKILRDITLEVKAGSCVAVMGSSGSGKTTLLSVLSGRSQSGKVTGKLLVGGEERDLGFLSPVTGYVPQDDVLHGELTARENIWFQAKLRNDFRDSNDDIDDVVQEVAKSLRLSDEVLRSRVGTPEIRGISGGQRKRVSIAMELVARPRLLFADEPTSGLDSTIAHEVIQCLRNSTRANGTTILSDITVLSVIHQPRWETLCLFDEIILLKTGGTLVYSGRVQGAAQLEGAAPLRQLGVVNWFKTVHDAKFPLTSNPADVLIDKFQNLEELPSSRLHAYFGEPWSNLERLDEEPFARIVPPFFRRVFTLMDRAMLQTTRSVGSILINQVLSVMVISVICVVMPSTNLSAFFIQSCFAILFLGLIQGTSALRIFGNDLLMTLREAQVGIDSISYLVAKDLATLFEITLSAAVFASTYGTFSGTRQSPSSLFEGAWAFIYSVYGLGYIFSMLLPTGPAQMLTVVYGFLSFVASGMQAPMLPAMIDAGWERGWVIPTLSSVRWFWGYTITQDILKSSSLAKEFATHELAQRGYDWHHMDCTSSDLESETGVVTLFGLWRANRGWVCDGVDMILLGIIFRFLAAVALVISIRLKTSSLLPVFVRVKVADRGCGKLLGKLALLAIWSLMVLFLLGSICIFSIQSIDLGKFLKFVSSSWHR